MESHESAGGSIPRARAVPPTKWHVAGRGRRGRAAASGPEGPEEIERSADGCGGDACPTPPVATGGLSRPERRAFMARTLALVLVLFGGLTGARAQPPNVRIGEAVPRDVRELYDKGLQYLAKTQTERGDWTGGQSGPGVTGLGLMVFLASGEDPNFGVYSNHVRRAIRRI